ncbi:hypothetical protein BLD44_000655 [Mastigocladus laminosus UU774]|nr:hypothetical protein BLD44_000655 [Mastigocladus laminosus UU774]
MQLELDHVFICVDPQAPEAEVLKAFGLKQGRGRIHHGQGSANVCFFFHNAYLELLWLNDPNEIQSPVVQPIGLWERCRWKETQACPFGISFRTATPPSQLPFPTWDYHAPFLPEGFTIPMITKQNNLAEPLIFVWTGTQKPANYPPDKRQPLDHQPPFKEMTAVRVCLPGEQNLSAEVTKLIEEGLINFYFGFGDRYQIELEFDHAKEGKHHSFDSTLPLVIKW